MYVRNFAVQSLRSFFSPKTASTKVQNATGRALLVVVPAPHGEGWGRAKGLQRLGQRDRRASHQIKMGRSQIGQHRIFFLGGRLAVAVSVLTKKIKKVDCATTPLGA